MSICDLKCSGKQICQFDYDSNSGSKQLVMMCKDPSYDQSSVIGNGSGNEGVSSLNLVIICLVVLTVIITFLGFIFIYKLRKKRKSEALHKENRRRVMIQMMKEPIPSISESRSYDFSLLPYYMPNNQSILNEHSKHVDSNRSFQSIIYMNPESTTSPQESRLSSLSPPTNNQNSYHRVSSQYYTTYDLDLEKSTSTEQTTSEKPNQSQLSKETTNK
ncbi:hypothetical protein CONCODRAFT_80415 [Conidiobolus coronatus NRRL 28638]|uniref:Uncharacterized protein n=1 Tax=Conidiobolus coronatus (strain ATCC 28846 / CBS 209.66 / NRRL 28638) TaxID=796925 RepID=A0A137NVA5_CONC2|nr:hypothetical protein CONCODRAFT_80415 [Conidiobolus coronatus NRRL 28638]|eukprot:KXN66697.1 hypothetical protein CONCODRAFT_80415 [Conidiobolus coronatus NRRL 28638]